jgi:hypothetical protein
MVGEERDVFTHLTQRRRAKGDDGESIIKVATEQPLRHSRFEIPVG